MQTRRLYKADEYLLLDMSKDDASESSRMRISSFIEDRSNYFVATIMDNEIIGFLLAYKLKRYDGRQSMVYIHEVDVCEEHRRQGIATMLFEEIKKICKDEEVLKIFLVTNESNIAAMKLYEAEGFVRHDEDEVVFEFKAF